tara:strand:- start:2500 stop:3906 length:1407 start_codon:yes stop_codon:yes gene_type:complete
VIPPTRFSRGLALLAAGAFFMESIDATILQTALPAIASELGVTAVGASVTIVAYLLVVAIALPATGWLGDRLGVRVVFLLAVAIFTIGSLGCALSGDLIALTTWRIVQGFGGALMIPVGRTAVLRTARPAELLEAVAYLTWPGLIAPVIAPAIGGVLTDTVGWRWIFLLNIPLGVAAILIGLKVVPRSADDASRTRFDWWGFAWIGAALVLITLGAEGIATRAAPLGVALAALAIGITAGAYAVRSTAARAGALLDWTLMRSATFRVANLSGAVYRMTITAVPLIVTLQYQLAFGWEAWAAGLAVAAIFAGNVGIKPFTTRLIRRWGFRRLLTWSVALGALALIGLAGVDAGTSIVVIVILLTMSGVFRSSGFTAYATIQFTDVPPERLAAANTLSSTLQQVATVLGVAWAALLVHGGAVASAALGVDDVWAYRFALAATAALLLVPLWGAWRLPRDAGHAAIAPRQG